MFYPLPACRHTYPMLEGIKDETPEDRASDEFLGRVWADMMLRSGMMARSAAGVSCSSPPPMANPGLRRRRSLPAKRYVADRSAPYTSLCHDDRTSGRFCS